MSFCKILITNLNITCLFICKKYWVQGVCFSFIWLSCMLYMAVWTYGSNLSCKSNLKMSKNDDFLMNKMIIKNIIYYFKKRFNLSLFIFQALQLFEAISNFSLYFILALTPAWAVEKVSANIATGSQIPYQTLSQPVWMCKNCSI